MFDRVLSWYVHVHCAYIEHREKRRLLLLHVKMRIQMCLCDSTKAAMPVECTPPFTVGTLRMEVKLYNTV